MRTASLARILRCVRGRALSSSAACLAALLSVTAPARAAEPWAHADPEGSVARVPLGASIGFRGAAEARANALAIRSLDLQGKRDRNFAVVEHRLRLDAGLDWEDRVRVVTSTDLLDGTLWGENGTREGAVATSGSSAFSVNPNGAGTCVSLRAGEVDTSPGSYRYGLCNADPVFVRRLYGDLLTPIGLFRIGRQAFTEGASITVNDGNGRANRFGFARRGNSVDRVLFATKPLELVKPEAERDRGETAGVFLVLANDRLVGNDPQRFADDLHGFLSAVRWLEPSHRLGGDFEGRLYHQVRWSKTNATGISVVGGRLMSRLPSDLHAGIEAAVVTGSTREISEAFRFVSSELPARQDVHQLGARATIRWDRPLVSLYLEGDYASGDADPSTRSSLTQFRFADDANVGLLMFEHVLGYQSARAAAAADARLRAAGAPSLPGDQVATRGAFTNAVALFPQIDLHPLPNLLVRGGALFAWAPARLIDPVASTPDRSVNFVSGPAGRHYGTELDLRVQYRMYEHFIADVESAVLFPGSALEDASRSARSSFLLQARTTFFF